MPDILNPPPETPPEPTPRRPIRVRCDFCGCELGADGGVLKTSDKAREMERAERKIADLNAAILDLQGRLDTAKQELETLRAPQPDSGEHSDGPAHDQGPARGTFVY